MRTTALAIVACAALVLLPAAPAAADPACSTLAGMSGGPADQPPVVDIRSDGDVYLGTSWYFWDCPPYDTSGS